MGNAFELKIDLPTYLPIATLSKIRAGWLAGGTMPGASNS